MGTPQDGNPVRARRISRSGNRHTAVFLHAPRVNWSQLNWVQFHAHIRCGHSTSLAAMQRSTETPKSDLPVAHFCGACSYYWNESLEHTYTHTNQATQLKFIKANLFVGLFRTPCRLGDCFTRRAAMLLCSSWCAPLTIRCESSQTVAHIYQYDSSPKKQPYACTIGDRSGCAKQKLIVTFNV